MRLQRVAALGGARDVVDQLVLLGFGVRLGGAHRRLRPLQRGAPLCQHAGVGGQLAGEELALFTGAAQALRRLGAGAPRLLDFLLQAPAPALAFLTLLGEQDDALAHALPLRFQHRDCLAQGRLCLLGRRQGGGAALPALVALVQRRAGCALLCRQLAPPLLEVRQLGVQPVRTGAP